MKYPLGLQTFAEIREENYVYLDKTAMIHELIRTGKIYFLSRPRRFGKSLLISTLQALFAGKSELFTDLAISKTDYDFTQYPVLKFEFAKDEFACADNLRSYINYAINQMAERYGVALTADGHNQKFDELVIKLQQKSGQKVVLLIDEYDKPILNNLNKPILPEIKQVLAAFYSTVKSLDEHLRFVFITGVSKFSKVSIFSGMNTLTDITFHRKYAALCGVTQQELTHYFAEPIKTLANEYQQSELQFIEQIKHWYNGYHFYPQAVGVYNPYSLLSLFVFEDFRNFWFSTATPTFLLDMIDEKQYDLSDLSNLSITQSAFDNTEPENLDVLSLFVQTGYLTITGAKGARFQLDFPNYEVKRSFFDSIMTRFSCLERGVGDALIYDLVDHLNDGELDEFFTVLRRFFAKIPYDLLVENREKYYQSLFYAVLTLIGLDIEAEISTNIGRIDCVLKTKDTIYIVEFKLDGSKEDALKQIIDKQYAQKYQGGDKQVILLGVEFDQGIRNIGEYVTSLS